MEDHELDNQLGIIRFFTFCKYIEPWASLITNQVLQTEVSISGENGAIEYEDEPSATCFSYEFTCGTGDCIDARRRLGG